MLSLPKHLRANWRELFLSALIFWFLFALGIKVQIYEDPMDRFGISVLAAIAAIGTLCLPIVNAGFYSIVPGILIAIGAYFNRRAVRW